MKINTDDFKALVSEHKTNIDQLFKNDGYQYSQELIRDYWKDRTDYYLNVSEKLDPSNLKKIEAKLNAKLPNSYHDLLTKIGLIKFNNRSFELLPPEEISTLSNILEKEWHVNWEKEHPKLKSHTDKIIIFSMGQSSQQNYCYIGFDYRAANTFGETPLFYFSQDEIWNESYFSKIPNAVNKNYNTMKDFILSGIENAIEETTILIGCAVEEYEFESNLSNT